MAAVPDGIDTTVQPPLRVPLRHFVVALGLLVLAGIAGVAAVTSGGVVTLAHVHLLLAGWVCVTIAGAMTQFVPVWSGVPLYSRRLANAQLVLVTVGVTGLAGSFWLARYRALPVFGAVAALGFWVLAYNVGRTLLDARPFDVTERHFAIALGFFVLLTPLGVLLALDFTTPVLGTAHGAVLGAHATFAVFGAVGTTVIGALYQLAPMFTQVHLDRVDRGIQRVESAAYPAGVLLLAGGRLFDVSLAARVGGVLVALCLGGVAVVVLRCLVRARVPWTPMLSRYGVASLAMLAWSALAITAWTHRALGAAARFGFPGSMHLLLVGVVGFVVLATVYHVVPFLIWVHRYSDRLGLEPVPMIDDLYDARVARLDLVLTVAGAALWTAAELGLPAVLGFPGEPVGLAGSALFTAGVSVFAANLLVTIWRHSPGALVGRLADRDRTPTVSRDDA